MTQNLDNLLENFVNDSKDAIDGDFNPADSQVLSSQPATLSQQELKEKMDAISEEKRTTLLNNTNNTVVRGFCAKGPHVGKYVVEEMNVDTVECETEVGDFQGKQLKVKVPANPTMPWDGYALTDPQGNELHIRTDRIIDWLLANTYGRVAGGEDGHSLQVVEKRSTRGTDGLNAEAAPLTVKRGVISPSNPNHIIETYEVDTTKPQGVKRTVPLDGGEAVDANNKKYNLRGKVDGFPVFRRKQEFIESLGEITTGRSSSKGGKVSKGIGEEDALAEYLILLSKHEHRTSVAR